MRSHTSVTWPKSWLETNKVVWLVEVNSFNNFFKRICVVGSKFAKGSSKITTSGFPINAATIPTFLISL